MGSLLLKKASTKSIEFTPNPIGRWARPISKRANFIKNWNMFEFLQILVQFLTKRNALQELV